MEPQHSMDGTVEEGVRCDTTEIRASLRSDAMLFTCFRGDVKSDSYKPRGRRKRKFQHLRCIFGRLSGISSLALYRGRRVKAVNGRIKWVLCNCSAAASKNGCVERKRKEREGGGLGYKKRNVLRMNYCLIYFSIPVMMMRGNVGQPWISYCVNKWRRRMREEL